MTEVWQQMQGVSASYITVINSISHFLIDFFAVMLQKLISLFLFLALPLLISSCAVAPKNPQPKSLAELSNIVWTINHPMNKRKAAGQELLDRAPLLFKKQVKKNLLDIQRWKMLNYILAIIKKRNWQDFAPLVIKSWSRASKRYNDKERLERAVIASLHPDKTVQKVLIDSFYNIAKTSNIDITSQLSAWVILSRLLSQNQVREILKNAPSQTLLIDSLQTGAKVLDCLPSNKQSVLWLIYYLTSAQAKWNKAAKVANKLNFSKRRGLSIRHLPALLHLPKRLLSMSKEQLYSAIQKRISLSAHQPRLAKKTNDLYPAPSEAISAHKDELSWGDLAQIQELLDAIDDNQFTAAVFAQADKDYLDKTTELGGVITWQNGKVKLTEFAPKLKINDRRFIASKKALKSLYTGLALYHFHAQKYKNSKWAGPGRGDLSFVNRFCASAVVFTFITKNKINVDFYKPGDTVVDLGMIERKVN